MKFLKLFQQKKVRLDSRARDASIVMHARPTRVRTVASVSRPESREALDASARPVFSAACAKIVIRALTMDRVVPTDVVWPQLMETPSVNVSLDSSEPLVRCVCLSFYSFISNIFNE